MRSRARRGVGGCHSRVRARALSLRLPPLPPLRLPARLLTTPPPPLFTRSAEKGLSNYLIYHTSKTDKKVAAHAADVGQYEDDAQGNLVRSERPTRG